MSRRPLLVTSLRRPRRDVNLCVSLYALLRPGIAVEALDLGLKNISASGWACTNLDANSFWCFDQDGATYNHFGSRLPARRTGAPATSAVTRTRVHRKRRGTRRARSKSLALRKTLTVINGDKLWENNIKCDKRRQNMFFKIDEKRRLIVTNGNKIVICLV